MFQRPFDFVNKSIKVRVLPKAETHDKLIYVLEDDDSQRELITMLLEEENYVVRTYPNITGFFYGLDQEIPDLILMDVLLPDGNGIEVCNKIKSEAIISDIPVIMMSAHYDFSKESCPAQAFISKPYDIEDLVRIVEEYA